MGKSETATGSLPVADLSRRVRKAVTHLEEIEELLPHLVGLTEDERHRSDGRFRNGEADALVAVLDVADRSPAAFAVLADKDGGSDPKTFETEQLRDALGRVAALDELAVYLENLARDVRDSQLAFGGQARRSLLAAYEIAKVLAKHDDHVRSTLAPALDFYSAPARQAARTKAAKKSG